MIITASIFIMLILGVLFGLGIAIFSKKFVVKTDPRIEQIIEALPGANCGGCGFAGCAGFAEAVAKGEANPNACNPGGPDTAKKIAKILGLTLDASEKNYAVIMCTGDKVARRFDYDGPKDCPSANAMGEGDKLCSYGCLGYGTCASVCPFNAIVLQEGFPRVIEANCKGCGLCATACPKGIIKILPESKLVHVLCYSKDKGKFTKDICEKGCIKCKRCEKKCELGAIKVVDNIAVIDYTKCTSCQKCVEECPQKTIHSFSESRKKMKEKSQKDSKVG